MPKHCIIWHFFKFLNQIWPKVTVIVTLHVTSGFLRGLKRIAEKNERKTGFQPAYAQRSEKQQLHKGSVTAVECFH